MRGSNYVNYKYVLYIYMCGSNYGNYKYIACKHDYTSILVQYIVIATVHT